MKRMAAALFVGIFALAGCDDSGSSSDTTNPKDTSTNTNPVDTTNNGTTSAVTCVDTNVSCTPATPNSSCTTDGSIPGGPFGAEHPWCGATIAGDDYTCNGCATGNNKAQGLFRVHGFKNADGTGDPDYTTPSDWKEVLYLDGNTWYNKIEDVTNGWTWEARGYYFCSQKPEHDNVHRFWYVDEVLQDTSGSGAKAGEWNETDVFLTQGDDNFLLYWFNDLGGTTSVSTTYCRIGTTDNEDNVCTNPFGAPPQSDCR